MAEITNRVHVSPGIYASETVDMKAAANSIGVTKLAVVGETLKGPAFQPYWISSPKEFSTVFGGTSTKKFKGSNYPQYELPYIANEYLSKSNELCVVRTLGFSGFNAGPAWLITGTKASSNKNYVIAVLRSRGTYKYRSEYAKLNANNGCSCQNAYDSLTYDVGEVTNVKSCSAARTYNMDAVSLSVYSDINSDGTECTSYSLSGGKGSFEASYGNLGRFTINCIVGTSEAGATPGGEYSGKTVNIPVSLNKSDKDYILKVLGTSNDDGDQPLYVESLYDVAWEDLVVNEGFNSINSALTKYNVGYAADYSGLDSVNGILTKYEGELTKKDVGKRYLYASGVTDGSPSGITYYVYDYITNAPKTMEISGFTTEEATATGDTPDIEINQIFEIKDGDYAGKYKNVCSQCQELSYMYGAIVSGKTEEVVKVTNNFDLCLTGECEDSSIYTVTQFTDNTGTKHYIYKAYDEASIASGATDDDEIINATDKIRCYFETSASNRKGSIVYNYEDGLYYKNTGEPKVIDGKEVMVVSSTTSGFTAVFRPIADGNLFFEYADDNTKLYNDADKTNPLERNNDGTWTVKKDISLSFKGLKEGYHGKYITMYENEKGKTVHNNKAVPVECDLNDYKSAYRYSSTPWVVSNVKGDAKHIEVNKMFRFHTITDGSNSVDEVKVSIENIRPDSGEFDVVVRSYNDIDSAPSVLERYSKCTMASGKKFIGYMIGTLDGQYESKSKYITVEVADTTAAINSVPAGFLGYTIPVYEGATIADQESHSGVTIAPIKYNTTYDEDVNKKKQYFGISDRTGYDYDYFSFKGKMSVLESPDFMSKGFHLDCRLDKKSYGNDAPSITVDGVEGYLFDTVSVNARTSSLSDAPIITTEDEMEGCIYEDIKLRKFTLVFAGGFDGWDVYRDQRTNTNEYSYSNYKGYVGKSNGIGYAFDNFETFNDASTYSLEGNAITSDYYSTLAALSLLKNPEEVDINLLATPGIDIVNNSKLVGEVFDILEDRADTFYIVTTPDKEIGASDYADSVLDVDSAVSDVEDTELHSSYAATYYPWVKIEDSGEYLWIPATRDVVRNIAESDNTNTTMNLAPAGLTRGRVDAIRARKNLKLTESDTLYEANINPVRTYAQEGLVIMGQKTLRETDDLLNRIDVRRCVLRMRKLIAIGTLGLIFEPNDNSTVSSFKSIVNGIMEGFVNNRAISNWKMVVDESEEARDRLEIPATIYIKPIRALEYISLNLVVTNDGTYFED